jgi:hypothetical protein
MIKNGTLNAPAFTLPAGYRPEFRVLVGVDSNGAHGRVEITPSGDVIPVAGSNLWFQLDESSDSASTARSDLGLH